MYHGYIFFSAKIFANAGDSGESETNTDHAHISLTVSWVPDINLVVPLTFQSFILKTEWKVQCLTYSKSVQYLLAGIIVTRLQHRCVSINFVNCCEAKVHGIVKTYWGGPDQSLEAGGWGGRRVWRLTGGRHKGEEELSGQKEQSMQRPWGRREKSTFKEVNASVMELVKQDDFQ